MLETVAQILEWIDQYGADKVFLVFFFVLYWRANKRNEKLQDKRLEDNKESITALIEARHSFEELAKSSEDLEKKIDKIYEKITKES